MKKGIFITLMAVIICQYSFCKESYLMAEKNQKNTVEHIFNDFSKEKNIVHVKVGGFAMMFAKFFSDTKGVSGVEVYAFEECENSVKNRFNEAIRNLKDNSYETLVSTSENGERIKVLLKMKDDCIEEIVVLAGGDDPALIRIKGKIKPDDIQSIVKENK